MNPTDIQKFLNGIQFPASKEELVDHASGEGADPDSLGVLDQLPEKMYSSLTEIIQEIRKII